MEQLKISARWKIYEGKFEEFKKLSTECHATVMQKNPDHLQYDWYFNDELRECIVLETYADSNALLMHLSVVGDYLGRLLALGEFAPEVYGNPSQALLDATASLNKKIYYFYQGMKQRPNEQLASLS
jgi:quinol monooxygenase YgiN